MSSRVAPIYSGWAVFAGLLLLVAGIFGLIMGIAAVGNQYVFATYSQGLIVWDLTGLGWFHIVVGCVMIITSLGLFAMQTWARVIAVIVAAVNGIMQVFWLTTTPFWSIVMLALDVLVIYGLTVSWSRLEREGQFRGVSTPTTP